MLVNSYLAKYNLVSSAWVKCFVLGQSDEVAPLVNWVLHTTSAPADQIFGSWDGWIQVFKRKYALRKPSAFHFASKKGLLYKTYVPFFVWDLTNCKLEMDLAEAKDETLPVLPAGHPLCCRFYNWDVWNADGWILPAAVPGATHPFTPWHHFNMEMFASGKAQQQTAGV